MTMIDLNGQTAIVTGAGAGIGQAIALTLARHGARLLLVDRIAERLDDTLAKIAATGEGATGIALDITDEAAVESAIAKVCAQGDSIDILVNCAGVFDDYEGAASTSSELWNRVLAVNLTAPFILTRAILPHMVAVGRGAIINIGSVASLRGGAGGAAYTASKHALIGLTRSIAWGYRANGIRCNAVCPGAIGGTAIMDNSVVDMDYFAKCEPVFALSGQFGEPQRIADAVLFMASDQAAFINGLVMPVDGGWNAG